MSFNPFPGAFGLDIGEDAVRLIQLEYTLKGLRAPRVGIKRRSMVALPEGALKDGELAEPEVVVRALRSLLNEHDRPRSPYVITSLPEHKTFVKTLTVQASDHEPTKSDIEAALATHLPYNLEEVYLDWQVIPGTGRKNNHWSVIIAAVPKAIADSYTYLLEIAKLEPLALEVEALAVARALPGETAGIRAILMFGEAHSAFLVVSGGVVHMSLSIPFTGREITEKIAQALSIEAVEAEEVKRTCGLDRTGECDPKLRPVLLHAVEELTRRIREAMWFYKMQMSEDAPIDTIELAGTNAALEGLDRALSQSLKRKIRPANPYKSLDPAVMDAEQINELLPYTTAVGLALRALEGPLPISL